MPIGIRPLHGQFGAEITGIPPTAEVDEDTFQRIEAAWFQHSILLFRGLAWSPGQQIAFTRRFGPLHVMTPLQYNMDGHPEIFMVTNAQKDGRPIGLKRAGEGFHTDGEDKRIPNAGSLLYAVQVPPEEGDTLFVDMYGAYDALPDDIKRKLAGRHARFSRIALHEVHYPLMPKLTEQEKQERPDVFHPIFRKHPRSGRTSLYIGRWATDIEGLSAQEGRELIAWLQAFAQQPQFIYRHHWQVGDAILWDNRCTQHCAMGFKDDIHVRVMQRTTLEGDEPVMAEVPAGLAA